MRDEFEHFLFKNKQEGVVAFKQKTRYSGGDKDKPVEADNVNYDIKQQTFKACRSEFIMQQ
ncbi:MAG: hypothetical protein H7Y13_16745 [Sphingobacteriaceae bacterium]|nr:hypothetical protein [Sphingobacteriaceae bacterium]